jgi:aldose 1-epimerase
MVETVEISSGKATAIIVPSLGGGIARLDVGGRPVLRPFLGNSHDLFSLASIVLVPFSNRLSGGGFSWKGKSYPVLPNLSSEALPIHGDGFQRPWRWVAQGNEVNLHLDYGAVGPWRYRAAQIVTLLPDRFSIALDVANIGEIDLPFGGGFHPWFPRSSQTRLAFDAGAVWLEDDAHLPTECIAMHDNRDWCFDKPRLLPDGWINNCFVNWAGRAWIEQGPEAVSCAVVASDTLCNAVVFSPGADAAFFCFEPVSHPVDAFNLPGMPGLRELAPGERLGMSFSLQWSAP